MSSVAHPELADLLTQKNVQRNLSTPKLVEAAVRNGEGHAQRPRCAGL